MPLGTTVRKGDYNMQESMLRDQNMKLFGSTRRGSGCVLASTLKTHKAADVAICIGGTYKVEGS